MIYCLTGEPIFIDALTMTAVIECGGVGYSTTVSASTMTKLNSPDRGKTVRLYTYMAVREDAVELYGFYTTEELGLFKQLITVSGAGPKAAISILSTLSPDALINAVCSEDAKAISKAPGVGAKTAARIVLELHDKLKKAYPGATMQSEGGKAPSAPALKGNLSDARDALIVLGYTRAEVSAALSAIDPSGDTEDIIRRALAALMK